MTQINMINNKMSYISHIVDYIYIIYHKIYHFHMNNMSIYFFPQIHYAHDKIFVKTIYTFVKFKKGTYFEVPRWLNIQF